MKIRKLEREDEVPVCTQAERAGPRALRPFQQVGQEASADGLALCDRMLVFCTASE
jgi:hypothetical protein